MSDDQVAKDLRASGDAPIDLATVRTVERKAIEERRRQAGYQQPDAHNDLVGVALSGGGLRSAMFNLGLLQALQESGFMKYVDYLSTVSGGGYIGGFYSSIGHNFNKESTQSGHKTTDAGTKLDKNADSRRYIPELYRATHRFINAGQYLNQPWAFFAGYLFPSLAVFLLFFSGLVMTASMIALFLRFFDLVEVNDHLVLLNLNSEVSALCVAVVSLWLVFLLIYVAVRVATRDRRAAESSSSAKYGPLLKMLVVALLCGVAIMLGNYDFGLLSGASIQFQSTNTQTPMIALSLLGALALFRLPLLLRSDQQSASFWQKAVLWTILTAVVGGGSLATLSMIGSEGISGYAAQRGPRLDHEDIVDHRAFSTWLNQWLERRKSARLKLENDEAIETARKNAQDFQDDLQQYKEAITSLDFQRRELFPDDIAWRGNPESMLRLDDAVRSLRYASRYLERDHQVTRYLISQRAVRELRDKLVNRINDDLFYKFDQDPRSWHLWDHDATHGQIKADIDGGRTGLLLAAFSERVQRHVASSGPRSPEASADSPAAPADALDAASAAKATGPERRPPMWVRPDATASPLKPGDVLKEIVAYLKAATSHASRPLLGTAAFVKTLLPMIQPDGTLNYTEDSLDPMQELAFRRQLLEVTDPHVFKQKHFISTSVVVAKDQLARLWIFALSALSFFVLCCVVDFNRHAAVFRFYRERIARTFIEAGSRNRHDADMPLSAFTPWQKGFPYPLISAALKLPESIDINKHNAHELDRNPAKIDGSVGSEWYSFLLSPQYVGYLPAGSGTADAQTSQSTLKTYRPTEHYLNNELKVSDAITLSGAAFTPWMASNTALNLLMHVFNLRLEQWLPNPSSPVCLDGKQPMKLWNLIRECIRCSTSEGLKQWKHGIVADGGFREFLGVEELIARRCRIVVVSDAGCNNGLSEFGVLADLVRQLRIDHDVRILDLDHDLPLDTQRMHRTSEGQGIQHFIVGRIRYPVTNPDDPEPLYQRTGLFVYVQMSLTGDEDVDLAQFQKLHPTFPDEPITNQFFTADQVESLRQLGHHVGRHLCQRFDPERIDAPLRGSRTSSLSRSAGANGVGAASTADAPQPPESSEEQARLVSETRAERLADALVSAYLVECRQEQIVGKDDTPPDQPVIDGKLDDTVTEAFRDYEEHGRGLRLAHFVTYVVDGFSADDDPEVLDASPSILRLAQEIDPHELTGLAVECNRRHVGFRSENPDRFFRIGGRRLLLRSTSRAVALCEKHLPHPQSTAPAKPATDSSAPIDGKPVTATNGHDDAKYLLSEEELPKLLTGVARLAATVPEGIFRFQGIETSRDLTLCVLCWIAGRVTEFGSLHERLCGLINRSAFRRDLELAIRTGLAAEVCAFLTATLIPPGETLSQLSNTAELPVRTVVSPRRRTASSGKDAVARRPARSERDANAPKSRKSKPEEE